MSEATATTISFPEPRDLLTEVLRTGARTLLAQAVEAEVAEWIDSHADLTDSAGRRQVVRNGYAPERSITTPLGPVPVKQPRVRDRRPEGEQEKFSSKLLPPYLRKAKSVEELIPYLYLKGVSSGDFTDALQAILGPGCPGLSASTVTRLKGVWEQEYEAWSKRSLEGKEYVYVWADGIHTNIRLEEDHQCLLVPDAGHERGQEEADGHDRRTPFRLARPRVGEAALALTLDVLADDLSVHFGVKIWLLATQLLHELAGRFDEDSRAA